MTPLQIIRPYISALLLGLSLCLIFPIEYWHDCALNSDQETFKHHTEGEEWQEAHIDCELCDLIFAPYTDLSTISESTFLSRHSHSLDFPTSAYYSSLEEIHLLRGPPAHA